MKGTIKFWGIISVMVIGFAFISCGGTGSPAGDTWDTALNGRWYEAGRGEFVFDNGNWEFWWVSSGTRAPADRGTAITSDGNRMTMTATHVSGVEVLRNSPPELVELGIINPNNWYSRSQLSSFARDNLGMAPPDVELLLHHTFMSYNLAYSITNNGNTLFLTWPNGNTGTFTRIP